MLHVLMDSAFIFMLHVSVMIYVPCRLGQQLPLSNATPSMAVLFESL